MSFGVLAAGDPAELRAHGRGRGWRHLRILSSRRASLKRDLGFETADGHQKPGVSVFTLEDGAVHHFYSGSAEFGDGEFRGMDLLSPFWHFLDLTPQGRGDFMPRLAYED